MEIRWSYDHLISTMGFPILIRNPIVEIRRSYDRLISRMGFPIQHSDTESGPWVSLRNFIRFVFQAQKPSVNPPQTVWRHSNVPPPRGYCICCGRSPSFCHWAPLRTWCLAALAPPTRAQFITISPQTWSPLPGCFPDGCRYWVCYGRNHASDHCEFL